MAAGGIRRQVLTTLQRQYDRAIQDARAQADVLQGDLRTMQAQRKRMVDDQKTSQNDAQAAEIQSRAARIQLDKLQGEIRRIESSLGDDSQLLPDAEAPALSGAPPPVPRAPERVFSSRFLPAAVRSGAAPFQPPLTFRLPTRGGGGRRFRFAVLSPQFCHNSRLSTSDRPAARAAPAPLAQCHTWESASTSSSPSISPSTRCARSRTCTGC